MGCARRQSCMRWVFVLQVEGSLCYRPSNTRGSAVVRNQDPREALATQEAVEGKWGESWGGGSGAGGAYWSKWE